MKILLFGALSHITQQSEIVLEVADPFRVADLKKTIVQNYPELENEKFSVAVNKNIAGDEVQISAADEIALLPPFAGG